VVEASLGAIGGEPTRIRNVRAPIVWRHEESILIVTGVGVGRYFGSQRRSKVSMMIMRPPQQGHGRGRMCCSSVAVALGVSGSLERDGAASNWRAHAQRSQPVYGSPKHF
jgi:hypothetical protein